MDSKELIETWQINHRINLYLLDAIAAEHLADSAVSKGRTVGEQFAHINNVRLMWIKATMPGLMDKTVKIEKENANDKIFLQDCLVKSGETIAELIENSVENGGRIKGFKPHVTAFVTYLSSHEAHHRSQIILALKQSNHPLSKKILFGIWEFGVR